MSDGERSIFYFLGQCLLAPADCAIIIDEPESHVHRAIVEPLWLAIERARPDCAFLYITHDLDFATRRSTAAKYFLRACDFLTITWDIQELPEDTGLPQDVVAELVGSRKPILFVEGDRASLDTTLYSHRHPDFTVIPIGSCEAVLHSVVSYNASPTLHWLSARGLVDADSRTADDIAILQAKGVYCLPVAEVENLLLLPPVFLALAEAFHCADPGAKLDALKTRVMELARRNLDETSLKHTTRQLDRRLKKVQLAGKEIQALKDGYNTELAGLDPEAIFIAFRNELENSINTNDFESVLRLYPNKGLLALAATCLEVLGPRALMEKVGLLLGSEAGNALSERLRQALPNIPV